MQGAGVEWGRAAAAAEIIGDTRVLPPLAGDLGDAAFDPEVAEVRVAIHRLEVAGQHAGHIAAVLEGAAVTGADFRGHQVAPRLAGRAGEAEIDAAGTDQGVEQDGAVAGRIEINADIGAVGDDVVAHDAADHLALAGHVGVERRRAVYRPDAAAAEGKPDAAAALLVETAADHQIALENRPLRATLDVGAIAHPIATSVAEIIDQVAAHHPVGTMVDVEHGHRAVGLARMGVEQLIALDQAAGRNGAADRVDLEMGVEVRDAVVPELKTGRATGDVKGMLAGGVVVAGALDVEVAENPVLAVDLEGDHGGGLDDRLQPVGGAHGNGLLRRPLAGRGDFAGDRIGAVIKHDIVARLSALNGASEALGVAH